MSYDLDEYKRLPRFLQGMTLYSAARESAMLQRASLSAFSEGEVVGYNRGWTDSAPLNERTGYNNGFVDATKFIITGNSYIAVDKTNPNVFYTGSNPENLLEKLTGDKTIDATHPYYGLVSNGGQYIGTGLHSFAVSDDKYYIDVLKMRDAVVDIKGRQLATKLTPGKAKSTGKQKRTILKEEGKIYGKNITLSAKTNQPIAEPIYVDPNELIDTVFRPDPLGKYRKPTPEKFAEFEDSLPGGSRAIVRDRRADTTHSPKKKQPTPKKTHNGRRGKK